MTDLLPDRFPRSITSSMLSDLHACPHRFYLLFIHRLVHDQLSIHLGAGDAFAKGLQRAREAFYMEGQGAERALQLGLERLLMKWPFDSAMEHTRKPIDRVAGALEGYLAQYPFETDRLKPALMSNRHAIEFNFAIPLPVLHPDTGEPLIYEGRADMIGDYEGSILCTDEKTTTQLGETWSSNFRMRGQFIGYTWAALQYGYPVVGTMVRGIGILKTRYDFAQAPHFYRKHMIDDWFQSMCAKLEEAKFHWGNLQFRRKMEGVEENPSLSFRRVYAEACTSYGGCSYVDRCTSRFPETLSGFKQVEKLYFEEERD